MASLSGVSSSNVSSLYNSKNTISGLASGMDTEGMIEQLVQSYSQKITQLQQKNTKVEWKQEAYRSMISKLINISSKYTSYTSDTNLLSSSFFNTAATMAALGENKDKVSVSGKGTSDVVLNAVKQLATGARYQTKSNLDAGDGMSIEGEEVNMKDPITNGTMTGGLTLTYGGTRVTLSITADDWSEEDLAKLKDGKTSPADRAQMLANVLNKKLEDEKIGSSSASEKISISTDALGNILFDAKGNTGNAVYISGASGPLKDKLNIDIPSDVNVLNGQKSIVMKGVDADDFYEEVDAVSTISEKKFNINYNGTTKQIDGPKVEKDGDNYKINGKSVKADELAEKYAEALNEELDKKFGKNTISVTGKGGDEDFQLTFNLADTEHAKGATLLINTDAGDALGIGNTASNYLSTNSTLEKLLGDRFDKLLDEQGHAVKAELASTWNKGTYNERYFDKQGNELLKITKDKVINEDGKLYLKDAEGKKGELLLDLKGEEYDGEDFYVQADEDGTAPKRVVDFEINGEVVGSYGKDDKLSDLMFDINNNKNANVSVNFSKTSNSFVFTSKDTGKASRVDFGDGLASEMFAANADLSQKTKDVLEMDELKGKTFSLTTTTGKKVEFQFNSDNGSLQDMVNKINANLDNGLKASLNDKGVLEIKDKGGNIIGYTTNENDEVAGKLGSKYTAGQDAIVNVTVNGQDMTLTRSTNNIEIDGMTITAKDTFGYKKDENGNVTNEIDPSQKVTFQSSVDSDKIVDAIKGLITDFNEVMSEIKSAYSTMPYKKSDGTLANYEPLTEADMEGMSESAIQKYEEKAKQGILFNDRNLSGLYNSMLNVFSLSGEDGQVLKNMGITVNFSTTDGSSSIQLDEKKLRSYLETNLDDVQDLFTRSVDGGAATNGIMQNMKNQLDRYAGISGSTKGILVQEAGTPLYSLSLMDNNLQKQIDNTQTEIEKWQSKLSDRVDYYTSQFTRLELLINQMNSQSATLAGMMGG